jgi:hypothetical protein
MNRSTSLLIAIGVLVAHALVLFQDEFGRIAYPFDEAHVAFHMARSLVRTGSAAFEPGGALVESHPSFAWTLLAAVAERLYRGPNQLAQLTALVSGIGLVWAVSRFSPNRLAGVMAPLFVVVSGSVAAAIGGGTEWLSFALLCTLALLHLEEGRPRLVALWTSLAVLVRPEGVLLVLALAALALASRARRRGVDEPRPGQARVGARAFLPPLVVWSALCTARLVTTGAILPPVLLDALSHDPARVYAGWRYLVDFALRSGAMSLTCVPIAFFLFGRLSPRGRRALVVGLAWCLFVAWMGGQRLPMWQVMVPAIPFLAVAIQEALTDLVDDRRTFVQRAAWGAFLLGLVTSAIVSRRPADLGPLPLEDLQRAWLHHPTIDRLFGHVPGRLGLVERLAEEERRRCAAVFLRENLDAGARVATIWPGATAYIARRPVVDLSGRATVGPRGRLASDYGPLQVDLVAALASEPDFVLPPSEITQDQASPERLARSWLQRFDVLGDRPERVAELAGVLGRYELVSVPIPEHSRDPQRASPDSYGLLRHERLGTPTALRVEVADGRVSVHAQHEGHQQVVDLVLVRTDVDGRATNMRPAGDFVADARVHARSHLLLHASGRRWIKLLDVPLADVEQLATLRAALVPPASFEAAGGRVARVEALWP